jgi:hypothetical protein
MIKRLRRKFDSCINSYRGFYESDDVVDLTVFKLFAVPVYSLPTKKTYILCYEYLEQMELAYNLLVDLEIDPNSVKTDANWDEVNKLAVLIKEIDPSEIVPGNDLSTWSNLDYGFTYIRSEFPIDSMVFGV